MSSLKEGQVTICALLYGDYPALADRCIGSLATLERVPMRIGANAISEATMAVLRKYERWPWCRSKENICKYPMMRKMFDFAGDNPIETEFTMWFDDDSWVTATDAQDWLNIALELARNYDMIGCLHTIGLRDGQREWIQSRPWYAGRPIGRFVKFATGGWWIIRTELLRKFDWPDPEIEHRGGDVMLGALCWQQNLRLREFHLGLAINANESGQLNSSPKRGHDAAPVGTGYQKGN